MIETYRSRFARDFKNYLIFYKMYNDSNWTFLKKYYLKIVIERSCKKSMNYDELLFSFNIITRDRSYTAPRTNVECPVFLNS
jgi:hypothetical protein